MCGQSSNGETKTQILCWVGAPVGLIPEGSQVCFVVLEEMALFRAESVNLNFLNLKFWVAEYRAAMINSLFTSIVKAVWRFLD